MNRPRQIGTNAERQDDPPEYDLLPRWRVTVDAAADSDEQIHDAIRAALDDEGISWWAITTIDGPTE